MRAKIWIKNESNGPFLVVSPPSDTFDNFHFSPETFPSSPLFQLPSASPHSVSYQFYIYLESFCTLSVTVSQDIVWEALLLPSSSTKEINSLLPCNLFHLLCSCPWVSCEVILFLLWVHVTSWMWHHWSLTKSIFQLPLTQSDSET